MQSRQRLGVWRGAARGSGSGWVGCWWRSTGVAPLPPKARAGVAVRAPHARVSLPCAVQFLSPSCDTLASVGQDGEVFVWRMFMTTGPSGALLHYEVLFRVSAAVPSLCSQLHPGRGLAPPHFQIVHALPPHAHPHTRTHTTPFPPCGTRPWLATPVLVWGQLAPLNDEPFQRVLWHPTVPTILFLATSNKIVSLDLSQVGSRGHQLLSPQLPHTPPPSPRPSPHPPSPPANVSPNNPTQALE